MITREEIFAYVKEKYGVEPDYPFAGYPSYPVLRHIDSKKWFAIIMNVTRCKLGLPGNDPVDVLNVKVGDPLFAEFIVTRPGYRRGYHFASRSWISVLLDGSVPMREVELRLDESFAVTASSKKKQKLRPAKEWLVPANPRYYDIERAFDEADEIDWKQGAGIRTGDTVFVYVGAPVSAVLYKCEVTKTDIPFDFSNEALTIRSLMRIKLIKRYDGGEFPFARLRDEFGVYAVRGPRGVPRALSEALDRQDN